MREVTIPNDYNPFRLEVNGRIYSYKAGTTQSVPDEVAELIDMYNQSKPVPRQNSIIDNSGLSFQKTDADKVLKVKEDGSDVEWGEGGGDELIIINQTMVDGLPAMDKTWQEIYDALAAHKQCYFCMITPNRSVSMYPILSVSSPAGEYHCSFANMTGINDFYTDSPDGYPALQSS